MVRKGKRVAAAPRKTATKKVNQKNPLFVKRSRDFGIGRDIQPKRDLTRFVRWPKYIKLQRQRAVIQQGLKLELLVNPTNLPQGQLFLPKVSTGSSTLLRGRRLNSSLSLMMSTQLRSLYSSLPSAERWTFPTAS